MKIFLDAEFIEEVPLPGYSPYPVPIHLLSVAVVLEDGRTYYAEDRNAPLHLANNWVKKNVIPHLDTEDSPSKKTVGEIRQDLLKLIDFEKPEFWSYFADYDWVLFCRIFGRMDELPNAFPRYCRDLKQWMDQLQLKRHELPPQRRMPEHHALVDALWHKEIYDYLKQREEQWFQERDRLLLATHRDTTSK